MAKYRLTRDYAGNGTAPNNSQAQNGQLPPKNLYLTKKLKKGDIIEGGIATEDSVFGIKGNSIAFKTMGATTTNGVPYNDLALLYIPLDNAGALEEIDDKGNLINKNETVNLSKVVNLSPEEKFYQSLGLKSSMFFTLKSKGRLLVFAVLVGGYFAYKKFKK
jgi:hypothetical protein